MPRARLLAPVRCSATPTCAVQARGESPPRRRRRSDDPSAATAHRCTPRPRRPAAAAQPSSSYAAGGQEACPYPWTCDAPATREWIRNGLRQDTAGDGELARGTEQRACRSGCCPDERSGGRCVIGAPINKIGPISRLSGQLLRGPLQCPRVVHTDISWQLSRLLCARGEWPPCRRPAERCDKLAPRPVFR